jgi:hypothetical protein
MSPDRMSNPNGIIQNPRIGRKPNSPNRMKAPPMTMRRSRERGSGMRYPPSRTPDPPVFSTIPIA